MKYTLEAYDRSGTVFLHMNDIELEEVLTLTAAALKDPQTGGMVVYRPVAAGNDEGGGHREGQELGLAADGSVAGGNGRLSYCRYCLTTGGHTADCTVNS